MKRIYLLFVLVIGISALSALPWVYKNLAVQAGSMTKWEYCAIYDWNVTDKDDKAIGTSYIIYFLPSGSRTEEITFEKGIDQAKVQPLKKREADKALAQIRGEAGNNSVAKAIGQLGEQGWEMVGEQGYGNDLFRSHYEWRNTALYFRRQKP